MVQCYLTDFLPSSGKLVSFPDLQHVYIVCSITCDTDSNPRWRWFGSGTETSGNPNPYTIGIAATLYFTPPLVGVHVSGMALSRWSQGT